MKYQARYSRRCAPIVALLATAVLASSAFAGYEAPTSTFGVGTYYSGVTAGLTGKQLRLQLAGITTSGFTGQSYGNARSILPIVWTDPANSLNMIQIYDHTSIVKPTGGSIPGWEYSDNKLVWNREHQWPQSLLGVSVNNNSNDVGTDLFELAPADPTTNGGRGNQAYGTSSTDFNPGSIDDGDVARNMFYMATRYYTGCTTLSSANLDLISLTGTAQPSTFQMGDLQYLLHANYSDGVDNFERQRNQTIQTYQHDRNPFVDHPEYVWAIFGKDAAGNNINNSSQISVGTVAANGSSSATVSLGRVMVNGAFGTGNATVTKTGATPTTFDVTTAGNATTILGGANTLAAGTGQPFDFGNVTKTMTVGLNASTATPGLKTGTVTIDNTDLTTAAAGQGSADGNDAITVTGAVLAKRTINVSQSMFSFGTVITGASVTGNFNLTTSGDDNSATRVNVGGNTTADINGISGAVPTVLFNSATATSSGTISGTLTKIGPNSGSFGVGIHTAENGGAGLTGEGAYSPLTISYSDTVLAHSNASFNVSSDVDSMTLDFGLHMQNSGNVSLPFSISDLVATLNFTAGLDLGSINISGNSSAFTTDLASFSNLAAGSTKNFSATLDTTNGGGYDATYTLNVSDQNLPGATTNSALTLHIVGTVSQIQNVASLNGNTTTTLNAITLVVAGGGNFSGVLQNGTYPGSLILTGGTLVLSGNNTYSGGTTANGGSTLSASSDANVGAAQTALLLDNSTFQVTGTSFTTTDRPITIGSGGATFNIVDPANAFSITTAPTINGPLTKSGLGALQLTQSFTTSFATTITQGTFILSGPSNSATSFTGGGTLYIPGGSILVSDALQIGELHVDGSAQIRSTASGNTSTLTSLTLGGSSSAWTGGLDLTSNKLVVEDSSDHATTVATLKDEVAYGQTHADGIYDSGIDTNHRVVVIDNAIAGRSSFGTDTSLDSGSILITTALIGDADLSGTVDILDLQDLANHWQQTVGDWSIGDFDGNGVVDILDLQALANHWQASDVNGGGGSGSSSQSASLFAAISTPEPSTLALLAPALLLRRRRR